MGNVTLTISEDLRDRLIAHCRARINDALSLIAWYEKERWAEGKVVNDVRTIMAMHHELLTALGHATENTPDVILMAVKHPPVRGGWCISEIGWDVWSEDTLGNRYSAWKDEFGDALVDVLRQERAANPIDGTEESDAQA